MSLTTNEIHLHGISLVVLSWASTVSTVSSKNTRLYKIVERHLQGMLPSMLQNMFLLGFLSDLTSEKARVGHPPVLFSIFFHDKPL